MIPKTSAGEHVNTDKLHADAYDRDDNAPINSPPDAPHAAVMAYRQHHGRDGGSRRFCAMRAEPPDMMPARMTPMSDLTWCREDEGDQFVTIYVHPGGPGRLFTRTDR